MSDEQKREALAAYAHEAWAGWMRWMFENGGRMREIQYETGYWPTVWIMTPENFERWQRQMNTEFSKLPEGEKKSDYEEADKILAIIK